LALTDRLLPLTIGSMSIYSALLPSTTAHQKVLGLSIKFLFEQQQLRKEEEEERIAGHVTSRQVTSYFNF
jgi:hypothetical protein